jgi:hypothetical protein
VFPVRSDLNFMSQSVNNDKLHLKRRTEYEYFDDNSI